jgi:phospholipase/carboxylesterase
MSSRFDLPRKAIRVVPYRRVDATLSYEWATWTRFGLRDGWTQATMAALVHNLSMSMGGNLAELGSPVVKWGGSKNVNAPLVVLLHGWGETESDMNALISSLPIGPSYASVRAPYARGRHYDWFAVGQSFDDTVAWFRRWLDGVAPKERTVLLVGFSAGAAFGGGALLVDPDRYVGAAVLYGTLPFDAGVATPPGRLTGKDVFVAQSTDDPMIPHDLLDRAWTYLTEGSGARAHAVRHAGGHGVSPDALSDLNLWLSALTSKSS